MSLSFWVRWFNLLRMLAILNQILEFILPAQTSFLTWAGSRPIKLSSFVPLSLLKLSILNQSICFWSFDLEIIIPLHVSFELASCFYNPMPSHCFFLWLCADTHPRSFVGFYPTMSFIFNNLEPFLGCIPPLVNCIPCFVNHALLSSLCYLLLKFVVYVPKRPDGLDICLL